ncbi:MAG: AtpZ/AtpI family protein [Saprospiraceae bacterium]
MDKKQPKKSANIYLKYSGLAFQLGATIAIGAFIGHKLDEWAQFDKQYLTALFAVLFTLAGLYITLKDL